MSAIPHEGDPHFHPGQFGSLLCHDHDGFGYHQHARDPGQGMTPAPMRPIMGATTNPLPVAGPLYRPPMTTDDLDNRFSYHAPKTEARRTAHESIRGACREVAGLLDGLLPEGREKSLAVTNLEQVMFWGNAALARTPDEG